MYSNASQREWTVEQRWEGDMDQNLLYWARKVGRWRGWWIHSTRSNYISTTIQRLASGAFEGLCVNDNSVAWAGASGVTEKGNEEREGEEGKKKR